jgi:hypothetical protein
VYTSANRRNKLPSRYCSSDVAVYSGEQAVAVFPSVPETSSLFRNYSEEDYSVLEDVRPGKPPRQIFWTGSDVANYSRCMNFGYWDVGLKLH